MEIVAPVLPPAPRPRPRPRPHPAVGAQLTWSLAWVTLKPAAERTAQWPKEFQNTIVHGFFVTLAGQRLPYRVQVNRASRHWAVSRVIEPRPGYATDRYPPFHVPNTRFGVHPESDPYDESLYRAEHDAFYAINRRHWDDTEERALYLFLLFVHDETTLSNLAVVHLDELVAYVQRARDVLRAGGNNEDSDSDA